MAHRKFTADNIFTGYEMLNDDSVLVTDENGKVLDVVQREDAGGDVERLSGMITPGFINCHCHLELSHMKGQVPRNTGMVSFLLAVMGSRNQDSEKIAEAIVAAEKNMIDSGIVAVGDICNTEHTVSQKQKNNIYYHNFIEATGFVEATAGLRFGQALEIFNRFDDHVSVTPHAPYSVSNSLFGLIDKHKSGSLMTIHNQESHAENELFINGTGDLLSLFETIGIDTSDFRKTGKTSIESYLNKISKDHSMILVHNTVTTRADIDWVSYNSALLPKLHWCICPAANLYINNMLADVPMLAEAGCKIVVGTDSLASNDGLNIMDELNMLHRHFPSLTVTQLLQWATVNGAEALRISGTYGSLSKGRTPGIVLVSHAGTSSLSGASSQRIL